MKNIIQIRIENNIWNFNNDHQSLMIAKDPLNNKRMILTKYFQGIPFTVNARRYNKHY